ncbi:Nucleotide-binding protein, UspA family [Halapricum desulfuricans]|uniref:Nucleotide-binding protein, UspA family n=1 Tax=Halapricum desulfuricans TaxID=2841257 RepID=A0A897NNG2_9EURY|nr:universal stress protein [Halapricum desulfuricans]QSG13005.1 Nucleotide-binding protein, UspA family [Halapricum desulfuricans]
MVETILIPTDGSEHGQRAAAYAIALAEREGATLHALYVVNTDEFGEPALSSTEIIVAEEEDRGRKVLSAVAEAAGRRGVSVKTTCCHGIPEETIEAHADEIGADLIVLGERGQTHERREGTVTRELREDDDRVVTIGDI